MVGRFDGLEGGPDDGRWQTMISRDARGTHGDDRGTNLVRQAERSRLERQKRESKRGTSTRVGPLAWLSVGPLAWLSIFLRHTLRLCFRK